jgi:hypothetical protein
MKRKWRNKGERKRKWKEVDRELRRIRNNERIEGMKKGRKKEVEFELVELFQ